MDETSLLDKRAKEIEQEYLSSLADLNVNSKPLINMLTILAEENLEYAQIIVSAVEKHLAKVVPDVKLPILYLVDSIVKNVGKQYQSLFSQVIVNMFCGVFETVNEKIREKMYSLRQTWNEVFPQSKLFALDIKVHSMDPGWPITAQLKPKIHVNPMFLKATVPESSMHQQLQDKHRELLELQARKLELELFATKKRIEEQEKQLSLQTASVAKEPPPEVRRALDPSAGPPSMVSAAGGGLISTAIPPPGVLAKSRIAPVPQGMISMVKTRDPRLAKQQAAAQLVAHTAAGTRMMMGPGAHAPSLGPMTVPPPVLTPALTMDTTNHAPSKSSSSPSVRDRLGSKVRRVEPVGGSSSSVRSESSSTEDNGRINKKQSSSSSVNASSHKSRHDHDHKSRKERKEHSSSSTSTSSGGSNKLSTRNDRGSSGKTSSSSVSRAGGSTSGGPEKRKQRTHSNSDGSPQGRKSPHTTSPGKKKTSSSSEKTNHSSDGSTKGSEKSRSESKGSPPSSKVSRHARSNSTDGRKQEHSTGGGDHHQQASNSHDAQDIDLRFSIPEKRIKIDESISEGRRLMHEEGTTDAQKTSDVKNISPTDEEEAVSAMIAKDIDIRSLPLHLLPNKRNTKELDGEIAVAPFRSREPPVAIRLDDDDEDSDETAGGKKRSTTGKSDEPTAKKSKAEMIDALFGNEDVDLRQLPIGGTMLEAPPSMISADNQEVSFVKLDGPRSPLLEKNGANRSDAVRAKLAEVVKNQEKDKLGRPLLYNKLPDDPIERRRSISSLAKPGDIDLRSLPPPVNVLDDDDNSMDSMNSNIKTIIAQAQEQMEKGEITPEQYSILMKQVIQLNETQKIRQAQRIEHGTKQSEPVVIRIDDNGSLSGEDDVIVTSVTPASSSSTSTNDFRGKIHPIDGKPPFEVPFGGTGVIPITSVPPPDIRAQRDPRRQRESKWNRVEPSPVAWPNRGAPGAPPPGVVGPPIAGGIRSGTGTAVPSPWETAPFPVNPPPTRYPVPSILPPLGMVPHVGASLQPNNGGQPSVLLSANAKMNDSVQTINIDGIQREIRFYEDTAVIFMNWDEPKEIGFQKGSRMVVVDGRETFELGFNEPYKSVSIDNKVYQMRLGAPTRELYIDDRWYECYFGDTLNTIRLGDSQRIFKIAGPAPQVKIGELRNDLVAGKINMIVDAKYIIPVFLDCKVQTFELNGQAHTLQFADFLLTVVLDEHPYPVDFGSLPKVYRLRGREYYIRFTSLPNNVQPGNVYIRDMIRTPLFRDLRTPPKDPAALVQAPPVANVNSLPFGPTGGPVLGIPPPSLGAPPFGGLNTNNNHPNAPMGATNNTISTGLDYLTNLMPSMAMQSSNNNNNNANTGGTAGYRIETDEKASSGGGGGGGGATSSSGAGGIPLLANINVEELYKKIVAAGIITKLGGGGSNSTAPGAAANDGGKDAKDEVKPKDKETKPPVPAIEPVLLDKPETLKKRQSAIVHQLYSGMQCSSCGVRFPPEQTMKYSQHLDWHFRQNRRDRDSARKAHSRKWYYDVSDWIQYEEIEDLEEREKNWFETQQTGDGQGDSVKKGHGGGSGGGGGGGVGGGSGPGGCDGDDSSPNGEWGSPQPSCPAGSDEDDRQCHMCHEVFEQFYNEETEEWHLKCAIRVDGSTYHPLCYEDYKASLTMSETTLGDNTTVGAGSLDGDDESRKTDTTMETGEEGGDGDGEEGTPDGAGTSAEGTAAAAAKATSKKKTKNGKANEAGDEGADNEDEDEDDDVIVLPTVEPVVEEILDDDAEEPSGDGAADPNGDEPVAKSPMARQPEFQERQIDEDLFIQEPNIEVTDLDDIEDKPASSGTGSGQPADGAGGAGGDENSLSSLLRVKIKEEPKEDDEVDEEDALFEEVGTIESSLLDVNEHSSPMETNVEEDLYEDVIVESVPSPAEGTSNQQMAVQSSKPSLDGNVELQDPPQAAVLVPNRIKINITKSKALQNNGGQGANEGETGDGSNVNSNFNENSQSGGAEATDEGSGGGAGGPSAMFDELSNDAVSGWGDEVEENRINSTSTAAALVPAEVAFEETTNVAYERKPTLAGIEFSRCPRVTSGSEASGLCSIM